MSLPGLEDYVNVFVRAEPAGHHEIVSLLGTDKRRNERRIQVAAKWHHIHASAGHVAPCRDSDCGVVAVGHGSRRAGAPSVEYGARVGSPLRATVIPALVVHQLDTWGPPGRCDPARIADHFGDHDIRRMFADAALSRKPGRRRAESQIEHQLVVTGPIRL